MDVLEQIKNFPIPEAIHALQGYLCGFLAAHGILKDRVVNVLGAILVAFCFISYETLEQMRIHDQGDSDVMVFWATAFITGLVYMLVHHGWRNYRARSK